METPKLVEEFCCCSPPTTMPVIHQADLNLTAALIQHQNTALGWTKLTNLVNHSSLQSQLYLHWAKVVFVWSGSRLICCVG
jgi:hypothetical protein